jgi:hypothetical protein
MTPLQVIPDLMQQSYAAGDRKEAAALARSAAPYIHARAVPKRNFQDLSQLTDAELDCLGEGPGTGAEAEHQE